MAKIISLLMALIMFAFPSFNVPKTAKNTETANTDYEFVFVHGLSGWGSYDFVNKLLPHWGLTTGDMMKYLRARGFSCHSASVDPQGSAWDRACELYAQLAGTVVDYGKAHSEKYGHDRFGRDFSKNPLIKSWSSTDKINLLGHSFGGATVRLLAALMANGSEEERNATEENDISPLFTGGKADWIYSVTALAAPTNGTSAYGFGDPDILLENHDCADYDMYIDKALALNETMPVMDCTYYFAVPCSSTEKNEDGTYTPVKGINEPMMISSAERMGKTTGVTPGGFVVDESWLENDGLVNTVSAGAPFNAPSQPLDKENIRPGVWNVAPVYSGDHMALIGDLVYPKSVREFYVDWLNMINAI